MRASLHIGVTVLLAVAALVNAALGVAAYATREPAPGPLTPERIETASRPAVVLVQTDDKVSASIRSMTIPDGQYHQLGDRIQAMWSAGQLSSNAQAYREAISLVLANPTAYFAPGDASIWDVDLSYTGSGFFVTQDGYLVTAAHVVTSSDAALRDDAVATFGEPASMAQDKPDLSKNLLRELGLQDSGVKLTAAQQDTLEQFWLKWVAKYLTIKNVVSTFHVGTGTVKIGDSLVKQGAAATLVNVDPTDGGHDIAILKTQLSEVPTLPIAAGTPQMGDPTYVIGYPIGDDATADPTVGITVTTGSVGSTADQPSGWKAYGTTADFISGASGGPVMGPDGRVMGIVSYSQVDDNGLQVYGGGYFVPSEYISADLAAVSIKPDDEPNDLTHTYYQALADGDAHRYRAELPLLRSIEARSPFDAYAEPAVVATQAHIAAGDDQTPPDFAADVPIASAGAVAVITLTMLLWLGLAVTHPRRVIGPSPAAVSTEEVLAPAPAPAS